MLLLVVSSSRIDKVKARNVKTPECCVEIGHDEYPDFSVDSIVDCNNVFERSVSDIVSRLSSGSLQMKSHMADGIVEALREAVLASPTVARRIKAVLKDSDEDH